ncbi:MAG: metal-sensing transcriptional repressor [Clostridia bacterium]|nr:metal-sensing transcriptional repressor [Clostridia bacterium]
MNKSDVINFFNERAEVWDSTSFRNQKVVDYILDEAGVKAGVSVLDVACGTGELFGDYQNRKVGILMGVDIAAKMLEVARRKYPYVSTICADASELYLESRFDCIVVYNAFPHFPYPEKLIHAMSHLLKPGGRFTIAHGQSREAIDAHHHGVAQAVSMGLMPAEDLAELMGKYLNVDKIVSDNEKYLVSGVAVTSQNGSHSHNHNLESKKKQLNRLARASGHLNHVKSMLENDDDVAETLIQLSAVIAALNGLGKEIINEHIVHCISHAIENGDADAVEDFKKAINRFI